MRSASAPACRYTEPTGWARTLWWTSSSSDAGPGHEDVKGWGVFALPFDSGHVLALRDFPENDFGPYRTVWHRGPAGRWSIHVDGPRLDTACPRCHGPACDFTGHAQIGLTWAGPATLHVSLDSPALDWTLTATSTRLLGFLNMISAALPLVTWRRPPLVRARERLASAPGMGGFRLSGTVPSGHRGTLIPQRSRARYRTFLQTGER